MKALEGAAQFSATGTGKNCAVRSENSPAKASHLARHGHDAVQEALANNAITATPKRLEKRQVRGVELPQTQVGGRACTGHAMTSHQKDRPLA